jgi:hypothetical protein
MGLNRCTWAGAMVVVVAACSAGSSHPSAGNGSSSSTNRGRASRALLAEGLVVPATYQQACVNETAVCVQASGAIPAALNRPLHFPALRRGQRCPATPGTPIGNPYLAGIALGHGPVRPLIASAGDIRHGITDLDPAGTPGWREFKTLWFSAPSYQGPIVIRAKQLDGPGPIRLGGSGALPTNAAPLVVPPGPTLNGGGGWRPAPAGTLAKHPGCYAWQVDGLTFSTIIIIHAVIARPSPDNTSAGLASPEASDQKRPPIALLVTVTSTKPR